MLAKLCDETERQVKGKLRGTVGAIVSRYLPQVWVFETEVGSCTLFLDTEGNARVHEGADKDRDVALRWTCAGFAAVLGEKKHDRAAPGSHPDVMVHTEKGRAAFNCLRKETGL